MKEIKTLKVGETEYKVRELKGQDLFLFFQIADKLNIDAKQINDAGGKIDYLTLDEYKKAHPALKGTALDKSYEAYLNETASGLMSLGVMTFIIKKSHLAKVEINQAICAAWDMDMKTIKELSIKDYMNALKGAMQIKAIVEAFKSFFQLDDQK